jgi:hypothetical protein
MLEPNERARGHNQRTIILSPTDGEHEHAARGTRPSSTGVAAAPAHIARRHLASGRKAHTTAVAHTRSQRIGAKPPNTCPLPLAHLRACTPRSSAAACFLADSVNAPYQTGYSPVIGLNVMVATVSPSHH